MTNRLSEKLGKKISFTRECKALTQKQLAETVGVHPTYISRIEHDALLIPPSRDLLQRLADALELDFIDLCILAGAVNFKALQEKAQGNHHLATLLLCLEDDIPNSTLEFLIMSLKASMDVEREKVK